MAGNVRKYNELQIFVYAGTVEIDRYLAGTKHISELNFETQYPFGLYGSCSFRAKRDILSSWGIRGANRILIRNGLVVVYEGRITNLKNALQKSGASALIQCAGMWGDLLNRTYIDGMWIDSRMDAANWKPQLWLNQSGSVIWWQQDARLRMIPKAVAFGNGDYSSMRYDTPGEKTIKRITYDYDLQEGAQQWELQIWNGDGGFVEPGTTINATGSGSLDITLSAATSWIELLVVSAAAQTPPADGSVYGEFSNMKIYYETGSINLTEICKDVVGYLSTDGIVNSDVSKIASNALTIDTFHITTGTAARILAEASKYGDANYNQWAVGVKDSETAQVPNGLPVIYAEQFLALTDYDYEISMSEVGAELAQNIDTVVNWVVLEYNDPNGNRHTITPDADATLKDDDSIDLYGKRLPPGGVLKLDTEQTLALNFGRVYLAQNKLPLWTASGPIRVKGYLRHKQQMRFPASQIQSGKRIRVANALQDLSGTGLTFLIQKTNYIDDSETNEVTIGIPNDLVTWVSQNQEGMAL